MEWKFKENAKHQTGSDGFWYDLTEGGYLEPDELLSDPEQLKTLKEAIDLLYSFEQAIMYEELYDAC